MALMLGKAPKKWHAKTLFYRNYHVAVPPAPSVCYYDKRIRQSDWQMYLNDNIGCCAVADPAHEILLHTSYTRQVANPTDNDVLNAYEKISGYVPGDASTDSGCAMTDVWNYWSMTGIAGDKIAGWVEIDVKNADHVKQAIFAFGGIHLGVQLPNSALDQFNAGQPWTVLPDDGGLAGGHAVYVPGYRQGDWICPVTWGKAIEASWEWMLKYADEAYATVSLDWLSNIGLSPSHLNLDALKQDLLALQK
jgi:hypothetical protein